MDNFLSGIQQIGLGIAAFFTTVTHSGSITPVVTPTPQPTFPPNIITRSGKYDYQNYQLRYTLHIPKDGGAISGEVSGVCNGPILGDFDGKEGGIVKGVAQANCKIAVFSYHLEGRYTGKLYLKQGKVDLDWVGQIPFTQNHGSFTVGFDPVN